MLTRLELIHLHNECIAKSDIVLANAYAQAYEDALFSESKIDLSDLPTEVDLSGEPIAIIGVSGKKVKGFKKAKSIASEKDASADASTDAELDALVSTNASTDAPVKSKKVKAQAAQPTEPIEIPDFLSYSERVQEAFRVGYSVEQVWACIDTSNPANFVLHQPTTIPENTVKPLTQQQAIVDLVKLLKTQTNLDATVLHIESLTGYIRANIAWTFSKFHLHTKPEPVLDAEGNVVVSSKGAKAPKAENGKTQKEIIVELNAQGMGVDEIVAATGIKKSNVSWHFSQLKLHNTKVPKTASTPEDIDKQIEALQLKRAQLVLQAQAELEAAEEQAELESADLELF